MKGINEVKNDLRELKKQVHAIKSLEIACKTHEARIKLLSRLPKTNKTEELLRNEERLVSELNAEYAFERAQELEKRYIGAISTLSPTDKAIMVSAFFSGEPYWKIGTELGFSEEGIRKRINKIVSAIAKIT